MKKDCGLHAIFSPRALAVIGASANPDAIGGRPIHDARTMGFAGPVYPVNPARTIIQGLPAFPGIDAIPGEIDLAIVAVAATDVAGAVRGAAARGAGAAIVLSAGFAEAGGAARQDELKAVARETGIRVLGPNCLGAYNAEAGLGATFAS